MPLLLIRVRARANERHAGNAYLMGLQNTMYFVVLSPSGFEVTLVPYDSEYCERSLIPCLVDFWTHTVLPAFEARDVAGSTVDFGWLPQTTRKRSHQEATSSSDEVGLVA